MTGAAYLCALGALRVGSGLVTVASSDEARAVIRNRLPEAMSIRFSEVLPYIRKRRIQTLAIGPGLGIGVLQKRLIRKLLALKILTVLDADGINNLSRVGGRATGDRADCGPPLRWHSDVILTPHEGELARLLGVSRETLHRNRKKFAKQMATTFGGVCLLKGHRTLIADATRISENTTGTPAMATGGTGDVLTGVIAGLLSQKLSPFDAARLGAYLHGQAGRLAAQGDRGLLAHEVADAVPRVIQKILK